MYDRDWISMVPNESNTASARYVFIAKWTLGKVSADEVRDFAIQLLETGDDRQEIIDIVGSTEDSRAALDPLLRRFLTQSDYSLPTPVEAARMIATEIVRQIVLGTISPLEGAERIWELTIDHHEGLSDDFGVFGGRVDEYRSLPNQRHATLNRIVDDARELLFQER